MVVISWELYEAESSLIRVFCALTFSVEYAEEATRN